MDKEQNEHAHHHSHHHSPEEKKRQLNRLSRVIGHLQYVKRMIEEFTSKSENERGTEKT